MSPQTLVIKIGSSNLVREEGHLDENRLVDFVQAVAALRQRGQRVVVVTSGAVAAGRPHLSLQAHYAHHGKQLWAAVGQSELMRRYSDLFARQGLSVGQVLLVREDLNNRELYLNARETLLGLLAHGVVPLVNENDVVTAGSFGGNDLLAAAVSGLVEADRLLILTNVAGLFERFPPGAGEAPIRELSPGELTTWLQSLADAPPSELGTGGMQSKLEAARLCGEFGVETVICEAREVGGMQAALEGRIGTRIRAQLSRLEARKRWLLFGVKPHGVLKIDAGAVAALRQQNASLLAVGVIGVEGDFRRGDAVRVQAPAGQTVAVGLCNYSQAELVQLVGKQSGEIAERFPDRSPELIHRDNLVMTEESR